MSSEIIAFWSRFLPSGKKLAAARFSVLALLLLVCVGGASAATGTYDIVEDSGDGTTEDDYFYTWGRDGGKLLKTSVQLDSTKHIDVSSVDMRVFYEYCASSTQNYDIDIYMSEGGADDTFREGTLVKQGWSPSHGTGTYSIQLDNSFVIQEDGSYEFEFVTSSEPNGGSGDCYMDIGNDLSPSENKAYSNSPDGNYGGYRTLYGDVWFTGELNPNDAPQFNSSSVSPDPPLIGENVSYGAEVYDSDGSVDYTNLTVEYGGSTVVVDEQRTGTTTPSWNDVFTPQTGDKWLNATLSVVDDAGAVTTTEINRYLSNTGGSVFISKPSGEKTSYQINYSVDYTDSDSLPGESITCNFKVNGNSVANHSGTESFSFNGTLNLQDYQAKNNNLDAVCEDPSGNTASDTGSFYAWRGINASAFDLDTGNAMQNWSIYMDNGSSTFQDHNLTNSERWEYDTLPNGDVNITFSDGSDTKYYFNKTLERVINSTRYYREEVDLESKDPNPLSLKADPNWLLDEGEEFTITASAPEGQSEGTLTVDGREVDRVYTATLDFGIYPVNWSVPETENYRPTHKSNTLQILSSGFGATSNTTMAFKKRIEPTSNPYLVNFSSFISNDQVRSNLGDVYTPHENVSLSRTGQNNQLLEIDHSNYAGSKINLTWGNYFANRSYSTTSKPSADTLDLGNTSYQEINPYYVLTYNLEQTGENKLPPNANVTTSLLSESGVTSYRVEDSRYLVAAREKVDEIETTVQYSATDIYQRNILPTSKVEYRNIYLVDANKNQVVELLLEKRDQTGDYSDAFVRIKKSLSGSKRAITEQYFDAEEKTVVYLINGEKYTIEVVSNDREQTRSIGNLYVDTVDLTKTIRIQELSSLDPESGNMTYNLYQEGTQVKLDFSSSSDQSNNVTLKVWNYTNGESQNLLYENTVSDVQQANLNYDVNSSLNTTNVSVRAKGIIESEKFGDLDFAQLFNFSGDIPLAGIDLPGDTLKAAVVFLITVTPMFFNPKLARLAAAVQVLEAAFFALVLGWISIGTAVMSSGGTIAFAGILVLIESWNESPTSQARVGP